MGKWGNREMGKNDNNFKNRVEQSRFQHASISLSLGIIPQKTIENHFHLFVRLDNCEKRHNLKSSAVEI